MRGDTGLKWTNGDSLTDLDFAHYIAIPDNTWDYERFNKQNTGGGDTGGGDYQPRENKDRADRKME